MLLWPFFIVSQPEFCINLTEEDRQAFGGRYRHHFQPESPSQLHAYSHLDPTTPSPQVNTSSFTSLLKLETVWLHLPIYAESLFLMIVILISRCCMWRTFGTIISYDCGLFIYYVAVYWFLCLLNCISIEPQSTSGVAVETQFCLLNILVIYLWTYGRYQWLHVCIYGWNTWKKCCMWNVLTFFLSAQVSVFQESLLKQTTPYSLFWPRVLICMRSAGKIRSHTIYLSMV